MHNVSHPGNQEWARIGLYLCLGLAVVAGANALTRDSLLAAVGASVWIALAFACWTAGRSHGHHRR